MFKVFNLSQILNTLATDIGDEVHFTPSQVVYIEEQYQEAYEMILVERQLREEAEVKLAQADLTIRRLRESLNG